MHRTLLLILPALLIGGCVTARPGVSATAIDESRATPAYWYDQPASAQVAHADFDALWAAAERAARDRLFRIDRSDYRNGILTTEPLLSQQLFEPWRADTPLGQQVESTLGTLRRTIRYEFERTPGGETFSVAPKVLIERESMPEQRITNAAQYRGAVFGSAQRVSDEGERLAARSWYPIGRDESLERQLAEAISRRLN